MSNDQNSLQNATAGLYNSLCTGLNLSNKEFQLIQGSLPVQATEAELYNFVDGIPPRSVATLYTSNPLNGLNANMQIILNDARFPDSFLYKLALKNYDNPNFWLENGLYVNPKYTPYYDNLQRLVNSGSSATINFDSSTENTDISESWAKTTEEAGIWFWGKTESSEQTEINKKASSSKITVKIKLDKYAYLPLRADGWFTQSFFIDQYKNCDKWIDGKNGWDKVFGDQGSCQRVANQALIVDGYTIEVTSYAKYTTDDFKKIENSNNINVWPFYVSGDQNVVTTTSVHNSDGSITTIITCKQGHLQILGVGVIPTDLAVTGGNSNTGKIMVSRMI